jgi:hypothetical protein
MGRNAPRRLLRCTQACHRRQPYGLNVLKKPQSNRKPGFKIATEGQCQLVLLRVVKWDKT